MSNEVKVNVPRWWTVKHWQIKGRPSTQKRVGSTWRGLPGGENPKPGFDYRIKITWGPLLRVTNVENFMIHVQLRVVFDGWNINDRLRFKNSIQFYTDNTYQQPTGTVYRIHLTYLTETVFQPYFADVVDYAYFRVSTERDRAWRMHYNIGIYGAVYQGIWKKVTAL